jgi:hypothetical protein
MKRLFGIACVVIVGLFALGIHVMSIMRWGSKDINGDRPGDIVRKCVEEIQRKNYSEAAKLWKKGDMQNIEKNNSSSFEEYCEEFFQCDTFSLSHPKREKGYHVVYYNGWQRGAEKHYMLFLQKVDHRWCLREELIIRPEFLFPKAKNDGQK